MKTTDIIINELNEKINSYVKNNHLFCGGCCYSAYVLARNLKMLGIKYKVVLFQYLDILHAKNFYDAINGTGVSHVAIEVRYDHKKFMIGDCSGIYDFFSNTGYKYKIKKYRDIEPEEILKGYRNNSWNWRYNTHNNGPLTRDINRIAKKYSEI